MFRPSIKPLLFGLAAVACLLAAELGMPAAHAAITIDWVTVGDPGNTADTTGFGAVADSFQIMKFEFTNSQYTYFLNSVDPNGTNPNSVYNSNMGSNVRGGITNTGTTNGSRYAVKTNMGDKPVNWVSWFDAARVSNWLMNGATGTSSMETGAYTLNNATSGNAPARNSGATYYIPTENQWYKAAYYKGGSTNAGYWEYATQVTGTAPTPVTAGSTGIGSSGSTGNFANYRQQATWNDPPPGASGNVTTVGTNGGPSAYGTFDMNGNIFEYNDLTGAGGSAIGYRGGSWLNTSELNLSSLSSGGQGPFTSYEDRSYGFRLVAVPEPSTWVMGLAGIACGAWQMVRRRRAR